MLVYKKLIEKSAFEIEWFPGYYTFVLKSGNHSIMQADIKKKIVEKVLVLRADEKRPRDGWDTAFDEAIEAGDQPEGDLFEEIPNQFDQTEWTW
jgi:antitoxin MazE